MRGPTLLVLLSSGCSGADVCAVPAGPEAPRAGDANGDGVVDVSDGLFLGRRVFGGGAAPACDAAVDLVADGVVDALDGVSVFRHLYAGSFPLPPLGEGACSAPRSPTPPDTCAPVSLGIQAPANTSGDFDATVTLVSPALAVEGWQVSLSATGCSVASADFDDTLAATSTEGGLRREGFAEAATTGDGAWSGVALGWKGDTAAAPSAAASALLSLRVHASPPAAGCAPCVLSLVDGQSAPGGALDNVVSSAGWSWRPTLGAATVNVCAE